MGNSGSTRSTRCCFLRPRRFEMRELAELGLGAKPYLNIEGSDAITDRSIQISNIRPRMRNSVAVSSFDNFSRISSPQNLLKRRPNSLVSTASSSESVSSPHPQLINSLNLHLFSPELPSCSRN